MHLLNQPLSSLADAERGQAQTRGPKIQPHSWPWAAIRTARWLALVATLLLLMTGCPDVDSGAADDTGETADSAIVADSSTAPDSASEDGGLGGSDDAGPAGDVPPVPTTTIRIVAANLTSGTQQSYDGGHGGRILAGLKPDIVLIQEFNIGNDSSMAINGFIEANLGDGFEYYREPSGQIPNGIISRFPIVDSGRWDDSLSNNREFAWARIDVPGPKDLWAVSLHLLTSKASKRTLEIKELVAHIKAEVPDGDFLVVGGDLNTNSVNEGSLSGFNGLLSRTNRPTDQQGNGNTNAKRSKPYDRLFADLDLEPHHVPLKIGKQAFPAGLVFDSRVFTPLSDVKPVHKDDSGAKNMQHMAVMRAFALPTP
ncbi:MAG: hypothetical protein KC502_14530 [Myxococcales bacterium]|nr:hypothetical protein [Myxococcales bacterium]